eukprot:TRINITY_DN18211_c0_g1_i1.p1 TRINITY_DN18211_c0_g1~~TRINITY_DN18211_c0_g1_i1.p1  ORF type:complete len:527 (-),score=99.13 TRINITY_DN18211_c0_g1_i1:58-1638(-)
MFLRFSVFSLIAVILLWTPAVTPHSVAADESVRRGSSIFAVAARFEAGQNATEGQFGTFARVRAFLQSRHVQNLQELGYFRTAVLVSLILFCLCYLSILPGILANRSSEGASNSKRSVDEKGLRAQPQVQHHEEVEEIAICEHLHDDLMGASNLERMESHEFHFKTELKDASRYWKWLTEEECAEHMIALRSKEEPQHSEKPLREVVLLCVVHAGNVMVEREEDPDDSEKLKYRLPEAVKRADETPLQAAREIWKDTGKSLDNVRFQEDFRADSEDDKVIRREYFITASITKSDFARDSITNPFMWISCMKALQTLDGRGAMVTVENHVVPASRCSRTMWTALFRYTYGAEPKVFKNFERVLLKCDDVDFDDWDGSSGAKTIKHLTDELTKGQAGFDVVVDEGGKKATLYRNYIIMRLRAPDNRILVEMGRKVLADGFEEYVDLNRLPMRSASPTECVEAITKKLLAEVGLDETTARIQPDAQWEYAEDSGYSRSYPGVETMYRKWYVDARVEAHDADVLSNLGLS